MKGINPILLAFMAMGFSDYDFPHQKGEDELNMWLRLSGRTLEQEYNLIIQKESGLSVRLRNQVICRYEKLKEN